MNRDMREYLAGYVDGELTVDEKAAFEEQLARDADLRAELEEFRKLKEATSMARYADLPLEVWEKYWHNLYRKVERGLGWILASLGAIILMGFGLFEGLSKLYANPEAPLWLKVGVTAIGSGGVFLLVSYGRERLFAYNRDRYKEVKR